MNSLTLLFSSAFHFLDHLVYSDTYDHLPTTHKDQSLQILKEKEKGLDSFIITLSQLHILQLYLNYLIIISFTLWSFILRIRRTTVLRRLIVTGRFFLALFCSSRFGYARSTKPFAVSCCFLQLIDLNHIKNVINKSQVLI